MCAIKIFGNINVVIFIAHFRFVFVDIFWLVSFTSLLIWFFYWRQQLCPWSHDKISEILITQESMADITGFSKCKCFICITCISHVSCIQSNLATWHVMVQCIYNLGFVGYIHPYYWLMLFFLLLYWPISGVAVLALTIPLVRQWPTIMCSITLPWHDIMWSCVKGFIYTILKFSSIFLCFMLWDF